MESRFFIHVYAPNGLRGIEAALPGCGLPLYAWKSGYNGKVILRASSDDAFDWNMDSSDDDYMDASGSFFVPVEEAERMLKSLSKSLADAGFPHQITLGRPNDDGLHLEINHACPQKS